MNLAILAFLFKGKALSSNLRDINLISAAAVDNANVRGLYFSELEIVAYDYRPGESVQSKLTTGGWDAPDWSYWVVLQSGYTQSRDNVVKKGSKLDIDEIRPYEHVLSGDFTNATGAFEIDVFEVMMYRTGIIYDNSGTLEYYGIEETVADGAHQLYKYPEFDGIPVHDCYPTYPGIAPINQDVNVMFVSQNFLSATTPLLVRTTDGIDPKGSITVESSNRALTADEESFILNLVNEGTNRRYYRDLIIIPFDGPIRATFTDETETAKTIKAENLVVNVDFDIQNILDTGATNLSTPAITYNVDASNIPLGLTISFDKLNQ